MAAAAKSLKDWDVAAVTQWLSDLHLGKYSESFVANNVNGATLHACHTAPQKLDELGVKSKKDRALLRANIEKEVLKEQNETAVLDSAERALEELNRQSLELRSKLMDIDRRKAEIEAHIKEQRRRITRRSGPAAAPTTPPQQPPNTLLGQLQAMSRSEAILFNRANEAKAHYMEAEDEELAREHMEHAYTDLIRHTMQFEGFLVQIIDKLQQAMAQPQVPHERAEQYLKHQDMCVRTLQQLRQRKKDHLEDVEMLGMALAM